MLKSPVKQVLIDKTEMNFYSIIMKIFCLKCKVISFLIVLLYFWLFINNCPTTIDVFSHPAGLRGGLGIPFASTFQVTPLFQDSCSLTNQKKIKGYNRIGPHNRDIISIFFGSLLGEGGIERKKDGSRITFFQEAMHVRYLLWLHNQLANAGYCNPTVPTIGKRLGKKGKVRKTIRVSTWSYTSFDWIYDLWYVNGIKVVPQSISDYLTPLALAIWVMDSGVKSSGGLNFIRCFSYSDCLLIVQVLQKNFGLKARIQPTGVLSQHNVYIPKESMVDLRKIVSAFIIPEMKYKLLP